MSPSDLGHELKPFVFLDLFDFDARSAGEMPLHPHSGIATVTVLVEGEFRFEDVANGSGTIAYGGVEWMRAAGGVWHGKEMTPVDGARIKGFQLWLALPPELENGPVDSQYLEANRVAVVGPASLILGNYDGASSPVRAPTGINYLLVTLRPRELWAYRVPDGHEKLFLAVASGGLSVADERVSAGELVILGRGNSVHLQGYGEESTIFVIGSAVPHQHNLALGPYSVHTSEETLQRGQARIKELRRRLATEELLSRGGPIPVFSG
jgi:redox-sensitive bicupin YhaK (pirin superfamily)